MKEGSFESSISDLDFETESTRKASDSQPDIRLIKTPDQIPDRLNLDHVPENILRSGVIESLISQNDDLMARLTIALRRVAVLEESLTDARGESAKIKAQHDNLKDQILIMREQSRVLSERARQTEDKNRREDQRVVDLQEQVQVLEIRYAELYASSQDRQVRLERELSGVSQFARRHEKYRRNVRRAATMIREELRALREKRQSQDALLQNLRANIAETTAYISNQAKEHKTELIDLTRAYESQIKDRMEEIFSLNEKVRVLTDRSQDFEKIFNEKTKLENELIIAQRRDEEHQLQTAAEVSDLQKSLARHRNDSKELALQLEGVSTSLEERTAEVERLSEEKSKLTEQIETLQLLWRDQQNQIEKVSEQKIALQKLNQELSIAVNEYRREIRELKERIEAEALRAKELEAGRKQTATLKSSSSSNEPQATNKDAVVATPVRREDMITPEIISKIDKALTSLHVGR